MDRAKMRRAIPDPKRMNELLEVLNILLAQEKQRLRAA